MLLSGWRWRKVYRPSHRSDWHPLAILGAQLRTLTGIEERGSSPEHAGWDFVGGRAVTGIVLGAARLTSPAPHLTSLPLYARANTGFLLPTLSEDR